VPLEILITAMMPLLLRSGCSFFLKTPGRLAHSPRFEGTNMDLALNWDPLMVRA